MKHLQTFEAHSVKAEFKPIEKMSDFFNLTTELDKKYFPNVKFYRDDKNAVDMHYAVELFNNGVLGYNKLITKLAKSCNDTEKNIHEIVKKYIKTFGDFKPTHENVSSIKDTLNNNNNKFKIDLSNYKFEDISEDSDEIDAICNKIEEIASKYIGIKTVTDHTYEENGRLVWEGSYEIDEEGNINSVWAKQTARDSTLFNAEIYLY